MYTCGQWTGILRVSKSNSRMVIFIITINNMLNYDQIIYYYYIIITK